MGTYPFDVLCMGIQNRGTLILVIFRHLPHPHRLVAAARRQQIAGAGPRDTFHLILVPLERGIALKLARLLVPDGDRPVEAGGRQELAAGRPRHGPNGTLVGLGEHGLVRPLAARFFHPHSYGLVLAAGGETVALRVPRHVPYATDMFR